MDPCVGSQEGSAVCRWKHRTIRSVNEAGSLPKKDRINSEEGVDERVVVDGRLAVCRWMERVDVDRHEEEAIGHDEQMPKGLRKGSAAGRWK